MPATPLIKNNNFPFQYTIIGEGQDRERLVFAAHQLGLYSQVLFTGSIIHQDIWKYYEDADIYLQYSIQEGFCNAVLEAQAMGLLSIVSDAEGLPENVLHGKMGWVVPKGKPNLLAQKIEHVLDMPDEELNQIRENAMARVKKEISLEKQSQKFHNFFN